MSSSLAEVGHADFQSVETIVEVVYPSSSVSSMTSIMSTAAR